jgi:hypothetical protein
MMAHVPQPGAAGSTSAASYAAVGPGGWGADPAGGVAPYEEDGACGACTCGEAHWDDGGQYYVDQYGQEQPWGQHQQYQYEQQQQQQYEYEQQQYEQQQQYEYEQQQQQYEYEQQQYEYEQQQQQQQQYEAYPVPAPGECTGCTAACGGGYYGGVCAGAPAAAGPDWHLVTAEDGRPYYYCPDTQEWSYTRPEGVYVVGEDGAAAHGDYHEHPHHRYAGDAGGGGNVNGDGDGDGDGWGVVAPGGDITARLLALRRLLKAHKALKRHSSSASTTGVGKGSRKAGAAAAAYDRQDRLLQLVAALQATVGAAPSPAPTHAPAPALTDSHAAPSRPPSRGQVGLAAQLQPPRRPSTALLHPTAPASDFGPPSTTATAGGGGGASSSSAFFSPSPSARSPLPPGSGAASPAPPGLWRTSTPAAAAGAPWGLPASPAPGPGSGSRAPSRADRAVGPAANAATASASASAATSRAYSPAPGAPAPWGGVRYLTPSRVRLELAAAAAAAATAQGATRRPRAAVVDVACDTSDLRVLVPHAVSPVAGGDAAAFGGAVSTVEQGAGEAGHRLAVAVPPHPTPATLLGSPGAPASVDPPARWRTRSLGAEPTGRRRVRRVRRRRAGAATASAGAGTASGRVNEMLSRVLASIATGHVDASSPDDLLRAQLGRGALSDPEYRRLARVLTALAAKAKREGGPGAALALVPAPRRRAPPPRARAAAGATGGGFGGGGVTLAGRRVGGGAPPPLPPGLTLPVEDPCVRGAFVPGSTSLGYSARVPSAVLAAAQSRSGLYAATVPATDGVRSAAGSPRRFLDATVPRFGS